MRGATSILITFFVMALLVGLYIGLAKGKLDDQKQKLQADLEAKEDLIKRNEAKIAQIEPLKAQLPVWREQFELFRAAIPVELEDDVFLRRLTEQLNANGVRLQHLELRPAGLWFSNMTEPQEEAFKKEHMRPEEIRQVRKATYTVNLLGSFPGVLRAFENLKLYGRIYSINTISGPAGGGGGTVFMVDNYAEIPIQVSGDIYYGLSENYLSQDTLDKFFGRAEALGAASGVSIAAKRRADQLADNPDSVPAPAPPAGERQGAKPSAGAASNEEEAAGAGGSADARHQRQKLTPGGKSRPAEANHG